MTEREQEMVNLYKSGIYQTKITQLLHCKRETLLKALEKAEVKVISKSERNRKVTFNPFSQNTDESFYWLGYLIADGNVHTKENSVNIVSKDLDHLKKYHLYCKNPNKIYLSKYSTCGISKFANKEIKEYLISLGVTPNKTFTINPKFEINWSLIRGLFDGDGSIYKRTVYLITGSPRFRKKLEKFLRKEQIKFYIQQHTNCWKIQIKSQSLKAFGMKMYLDSSVFLERKYERYRAILE